MATLGAAELEHLHRGRRFGKGRLQPLLRQATGGRYLEVLLEDRRGDPEHR